MGSIFDRPGLRYISHRGFRPMAPDNSLPGFELAGRLGQWAIETDVHISADGVPVCCHNETVAANFDGIGAIRDMTREQLRKLQMNAGPRLDQFTQEQKRMPLFSEYLAICRRFGSVPFIELKTDDVEPVIRAVHKAGFSDAEVVMSSTKLSRLVQTRKAAPDMFVHWIFAHEEQLEDLRSLGNAGLSWNIPNCCDCPKEKIDLVHRLGMKVCLRAADSAETVKYMTELGLDYLPTNCMHGGK